MALPPGFVLEQPKVNLPPGFVLETAQPEPEKQSFFRQVADVPLGVAKGAVQGIRMIADAFGAGSETSNTIKGAEEYLAGLMSAEAKKDQAEIARIMKDAEDKGVLDQVKAGLQAFSTAPIDTLSQALGTAAPVIVGALGAKILGAGALVSTGIGVATGAGMGAGTIKGSIYEETKRALIEEGADPKVAEQKAQQAQEYGGKNLDQILLGTVLGGVAAAGPLEKGGAAILARRILGKAGVEEAGEATAEAAAKGALRRRAEAGALEAVPEAVQAGQEQVAQNIALQREGFDVPTMRGVAGAATLEGLAGAGLGATVGGGKPEVRPPAEEKPVESPAAEPPPAIEAPPIEPPAEPPIAEPTPTPEETTQERLMRLQKEIDENAREIAELNRRQGMPSPDRPRAPIEERPSMAEQVPQPTPREELLDKQAEVDRARLEAGLPTGATSLTPGVEPTPEAVVEPKPVPKIVDNRPLEERAAKNRLLVMQNMLKNQGGDPESLTIVPHPTATGRFAIQSLDVPAKFTPELQGRKQVGPAVRTEPGKGLFVQSLVEQGELTDEEAQTLRRRGEVKLEGLPPSERAAELNAEDLAINGYINELKKINTPAAREFVRNYESGKFTREDVLIAVKAQRRMAEPIMLNFPKVGEKKYPIFVGPDGEQIKLAKPLVRNIIEKTVSENERQMSRDVEAIEGGAKEEPPSVQYKPRGESSLREQIINESFQPPTPPGIVSEPPPSAETTPPATASKGMPQSLEELKQRMPLTFDNPEVRAANNEGNFKKLTDVLQQSSNPAIKRIGELGSKISGKIKLKKPGALAEGIAGRYRYADDSIKMIPSHAGDEHTNAHETVHALISKAQRFPTTEKQRKFGKDIKNLYEYVYKELKRKGKEDYYGLTNEREFAAEAMTNSEFQYELMQIPYPGKKSAWTQFVKVVADLLGIENTNALTEVMNLVDRLAQIQPPRQRLSDRAMVDTMEQKKEAPKPSLKEKIFEAGREAGQKRKLDKGAFEGVDEELVKSLEPNFAPRNVTVVDRVTGMRDNFWQRMAQGIADQYRSIKEYSEEAYMKARLSKTVDGGLEGLMFYGQVFNDGGALNIKKNSRGMFDVLKPVGKELDRYLIWVALNRESALPAEKRSIDADLVARRSEFADGNISGKPRKEVYEQVQRDMNALNRSVLKVAVDAGLLNTTEGAIKDIEANEKLSDQEKKEKIAELRKNPIGYERFINDLNYIPFYRVMEEGDTESVQKAVSATGLTSQYFSKALKGGEKPFGDLMENMLRNWNHILSASMKNQAAVATVDAAVKAGAAKPNLKPGLEMRDGKVYSIQSDKIVGDGSLRPEFTEAGKGTVKVVMEGKNAYYEVTDPLLLDAITSIGYLGPQSKFLDIARDFKNILQYGVTISPQFKVNNLIRDSVAAMGVSELRKNPIANVLEGISLSDRNSPTYISAMAGGAIFNFGTAYEGDQSKLIKRLLKMGVDRDHILDSKERITSGLRYAWDKYQEWGNKSEAANRLALYQQLRDKGMSHLEASFKARDLLDFSMQGSWPAFRVLTQVIPFLNARVQGLYKLGRDGIIPWARVINNTVTGKPSDATDRQKAQQFAIVSGAVMLASGLLYLLFKDDEEYKRRDEWDRDNFWWFRLPGMDFALRVPKPFEIGALGTLVERTLEQIYDSGAEGKQFTDALTRTLGSTFALNPIPQMFKPLVDIYANKDAFTGAPIESAGLERLSKQERMINTTSPLAIALGKVSTLFPEAMELSPVQADYLIKGYFGWLGATAASTSMYATAPFNEGEYPDARWMDRLSLGLARELPGRGAKYVTAFYESNKEISQAFADMRHYAEIGDSEKVQKLLEEKGDKIQLAKFYDKTAKTMANIRKQVRVVQTDPKMDGAAKKEEIDRLNDLISMLARQAEETRKSMKP